MRYFCLMLLILSSSSCNKGDKVKKKELIPPPIPKYADSSKTYQKQFFVQEYKSGNLYCYTNFDTTKYVEELKIGRNILFERFHLLRLPYSEGINNYEKQLSDSVIFKRFGDNFYETLDSIVNLESGKLSKWQIDKNLYGFATPMPEFKYGKDSFNKYVDEAIANYRTKLKLRKQNRDVRLVGDIDKNGVLTNLRLYKKVDPVSDSLSLLIISKIKNDWRPAKVDNKPVNFRDYFYLWW